MEVCRVATFSNTDVRTASLKCFAAILSSHAPLGEVESWLLPGDNCEHFQSNRTSAKTLDEQNGKGVDAAEASRPWVMSHCLRLFSTNGMVESACIVLVIRIIYATDYPQVQAEAIQVMTVLFKNYSHQV